MVASHRAKPSRSQLSPRFRVTRRFRLFVGFDRTAKGRTKDLAAAFRVALTQEKMTTTKRHRCQSGFSLIELLIVVGIILVIAAIAIPELMSARMSANESAAVSNSRSIVTSQMAYSMEYNVGFSTTLGQLGGTGVIPSAANALLIDSVLAAGTKTGYQFVYVVTATNASGFPVAFSVNANPVFHNVTGRRYFYSDQVGVIYMNYNAPASPADPALQ